MNQTRTILRLSGPDTRDFLQGLITNDIAGIEQGLVYAAILTPQGKYIADFFLAADGEDVLLDVAAEMGDALAKRLAMYKLRAQVTIERAGLNLQRGTSLPPDGAMDDPRHPDMGWRHYSTAKESDDGTDFDALRVLNCIPLSGVELTPDTFILEAGFERLNGVDFRKGCYVGQEVTARMKHKTELRKGLVQVQVTGGPVPAGTEVFAGEKVAGTLFTQSGDDGIAYLRLDRAKGPMTAGVATVELPD